MRIWRWFPLDPSAALIAGLGLAGVSLAQEPSAAARLTSLVEALGDPRTAGSARAELVAVGAPAVPALLDALDAGGNPTAILHVLGAMEDDALLALPALLAQLEGGSDRTSALWALAQIGPWSERRSQIAARIPEALGGSLRFFQSEVDRARSRLSLDPHASLAELEERLDGGDVHVWQFVAEILREPRTDGDPVPLLLRILEDRPPRGSTIASTTAAEVLVALIPEHPDAIPAWMVLLQSLDAERRVQAAMALGRQGALAAEALTPLIRMTSDPDPRVAGEAITALGMIGPAARRAAPKLQKLTTHDNPQIAQRAKVALRQIGIGR